MKAHMKRLLVVDDDMGIRRLLVTTLESDLVSVLQAEHAEEALKTARRERPDLILLDLLMVRGSGFAVCRELKQDPTTAHIPIVVLTALRHQDARDEASRCGADAYFTKPFSPTALLGRVEEILALKHLTPGPFPAGKGSHSAASRLSPSPPAAMRG